MDLHIRKLHHFKSLRPGTPLCSEKAGTRFHFNNRQGWFPGTRFEHPAWKPTPECAFGDVDSPQFRPLAAEDRILDNF